MTASSIPVLATTVLSLSQRARNLIHQHGDTSYRCGEWDGDEAGDYNTVHGEASDAEADLVAYVAELESRVGAEAVRKAARGYRAAVDAREEHRNEFGFGVSEDELTIIEKGRLFRAANGVLLAQRALDTTLAAPDAEKPAGDAEREAAARAACITAGEDPDQMVHPTITTPQFYTKPSGPPRPWWTFKAEASA